MDSYGLLLIVVRTFSPRNFDESTRAKNAADISNFGGSSAAFSFANIK